KKQGIKPLVTLHHFTHPQWLEEEGQWLNPDTIDYFVSFVEKIVRAFGGLCNEYCTINEPNVFAMSSYIEGNFPPGNKNDIPGYLNVSKNMIIAHQRCYDAIHKIREELGFNDTSVGFAMHFTYLEPQADSKRAKICYNLMNYLFHTIFMKGFVDGEIAFPLGFSSKSDKKYCDHIGINYYTRHIIRPSNNPALFFGEYVINPDATDDMLTDLGWEIFPEGLYHIVKKCYEDYKLPIYITENGLADATDEKRSGYIYGHLEQLSKLIDEGVDVQRYYYWSTMDNFEWAEGYWPRFGLYAVDYDTQKRTLRKSGELYAKISQEKAFTDEMIKEYLNK
ncbi:MAG: family 1 glycosylhydrolase, partial [Christensenellaceae bacterium]|nr:family 1 glycosylhydrolase [Christensenellaceae bacterium]